MQAHRALKGAALGFFALGLLLAVTTASYASSFTVENGDTLQAVAQRNGIPAWILEKANPQFVGKKLFKGDVVRLPKHLVIIVVAAVDTRMQTNQTQPNAYPINRQPYNPNPNANNNGNSGGGSGSGSGSGQQGQGQQNPLQDLMKLFNGGQNGQNNSGQNNGSNNGGSNNSGSGFAPPSNSGFTPPGNSNPSPGNGSTTPDRSNVTGDTPISEQLRQYGEKKGKLQNQADWDYFCLKLVVTTYKEEMQSRPKQEGVPQTLDESLPPEEMFKQFKKALPDLAKEGEGNAPKGAVIFYGASGGSKGRLAYSNGGGKVIAKGANGIDPSVDAKSLGKAIGYVIIRMRKSVEQMQQMQAPAPQQKAPAETVTLRRA